MSENIRDVESLCRYCDEGKKLEFLLFWGHRPSKDGRITKSCFSQWFPAPFDQGECHYPTAEHFMMAAKARLFGDEETERRLLEAPSPALAKKLGRQVRRFNEDTWRQRRFELVVEGNLLKFRQNPAMGEILLATGSKVLVEASPTDRIWGIGLGQDDRRAKNPKEWKGLNVLGFALMEVRTQLQS